MLKVMAVLRTAVVAVLIPYTLWALPWTVFYMPKTFDEQYTRCSTSLQHLAYAAGAALLWLLLETLVGWRIAFPRKPAAPGPTAPPPAGAPPAA